MMNYKYCDYFVTKNSLLECFFKQAFKKTKKNIIYIFPWSRQFTRDWNIDRDKILDQECIVAVIFMQAAYLGNSKDEKFELLQANMIIFHQTCCTNAS